MKTFLITLLTVLASQSWADNACKKDMETFCKDIKKGEARIIKCMHENRDKVSSECRAQMDKMKAHMKEAREACSGDVEKLCSDQKKGGGRIIKCLKENESKLSAECKAEMDKTKEMRKNR